MLIINLIHYLTKNLILKNSFLKILIMQTQNEFKLLKRHLLTSIFKYLYGLIYFMLRVNLIFIYFANQKVFLSFSPISEV